MNRLSVFFLSLVCWVGIAACGSDTQKNSLNGETQDCPAGEKWNPIAKACEENDGPFDGNNENNVNNSTNNENSSTNNVNNSTNNDNSSTNNVNNSTNNENNNSTNNTSTNNATNNSTNNTMLECGIGALVGKSCAPSGEPLAAADVKLSGIDCDTGQPFEMTTRTASDGTFEFMDVPSGRHDLEVSSGQFNSARQVVIQKDQTTDLTSAADKVCLDQSVEIAVIGGAFDHVEGLLTDLNLNFEVKGNDDDRRNETVDFLSDLNAMNQYDIIFVNCGNWPASLATQAVSNNLRTYVQGGKSLYFSDYAHVFAEGAFPDMVDLYGDDSNTDEARKGYAPQTVMASVETNDLQTVLGRNTATIEFPHDPLQGVVNNNWIVAEGVGAMSSAQLLGDVELCGEGNLFNPCPQGGGTQPDAPLLVTYKDPSGGAVVYTSFHNERQASLNQDMEDILRFLIFQL